MAATGLLYERGLVGQMLILIYSAIDTMGLLDAPPSQTSATGESFKSWVKKYLLSSGEFAFNDADLWAARCAVLHTFTSESDHTKNGKAREIKYFSGPMDDRMKAIFEMTSEIDGGKHVPAHVEELLLAFCNGLEVFAEKLSENCRNDPAYDARLRKIIQSHDVDAALQSSGRAS